MIIQYLAFRKEKEDNTIYIYIILAYDIERLFIICSTRRKEKASKRVRIRILYTQ